MMVTKSMFGMNLNRLIQVKDSGNNLIVDYYYNADYLRVEKHYVGGAKEQFYYCDAFVVEDQDGTQSLMREYMQGGQYIDEVIAVKTGGNYYYYMYDLRYNEYGFVDSTGTVVERARYDGYGKRTLLDASYATITTPAVDQYYSFTGQRLDSESGLQYYRARYFDNELGRFTNRDPIGFVDGLNLYRGYFVNNGVDPSGLEENVWWEGNPPTTNPENWPNNRNFANINVNDIVYKMIGDTYYKIDCTKSIEGAIKVMTFKTDSYWEQATTSLATDLNAWTGIVRQLVIDNAPLTPPSSFASSVANGLTASSLLENQRRRFFFLKINEYKCICLGTNDYRWRFQKTISKDKVAYDWISVGDHEAVLPNASQSAEALFLQLVSIAP
jgi:RHS repeat-associated protein